MNNKFGFTLIEVLIAMFISLVIMGGAYMFFNSQQRQTTIQTNVSDAQQTLRAAMDFMSRDIRMAGYDLEKSGEFGITDIKFRDINDADDAAGNSFIRFSWDKDSDGTLNNDETIEYSLVNSNAVNAITPGITDLYLRFPNNGNTRDVLANNIIALGLAYAYDDSDPDGEFEIDAGNGNSNWFIDAGNDDTWDSIIINQAAGINTISATGISVDTRTIRAIRIWMLSQSQTPDRNYTDTNTYVVGPHIVTPNNNFRHRLLERTILCRNMGL
jgi:type IV pilus assembly protein PilW